jgi:hypothetical protein
MEVDMDDHRIDTLPQDMGPENTRLIQAFADAHLAHDDGETDRIGRTVLFCPESLMATKRALGADYIRQRGWRTDLADRKYGHGWLDR